jgi:hypothetical protein
MMMKTFTSKLPLFLILAISMISLTTLAQDKTKRIGNKPRTGTSNTSFAVNKGHQIGIKMNAGRKNVQLLSLDFGVENNKQAPIDIKVNVYEFKKEQPTKNLAEDPILAKIPAGKSRMNIDLAKYDIQAKGDILVAIEFLETQPGNNPIFSIGLFNGGTYRYQGTEWKKMPVAGVDFNVMVKKL